MSGHSKWAQIKHKKAATDAKKGKLFSQLSRAITVATKSGADSDMNAALRFAIEKARQANMPASNIEKAIRRAGEKDAAILTEVRYEAYGPGGVALLIEGITDNTNRTSNEVKRILQKHDGKLAEPGAVSWMFVKKEVFSVSEDIGSKTEEVELLLIDAGAEDIIKEEGGVRIVADPGRAEAVLATLGRRHITAEASTEWVAQSTVALNKTDQQAVQRLYEALEEYEDITHVSSNEQT